MDEIDRELKLVQLQRERLALEREMNTLRIEKTARKAIYAVLHSIADFLRAFGRFIKIWRKEILALVIAAAFTVGCVGAAISWKEYKLRQATTSQEKLLQATQKWEAHRSEYANQKCGEIFSCIGLSSSDCFNAASKHQVCFHGAVIEYEKKFPK